MLHHEGKNRYEDFGRIEQLAKAYTDGFVHSGELVKFRMKKHGASSSGIPGEKFVIFNQNHDQIGNRVKGERLSVLVSFDRLKLAAAALFLSPYLPMLFMGEEYGEDNPFFYFVNHTDKQLIEDVRNGRQKEFEAYKWDVRPPDPQDESTFVNSRIDWLKRLSGNYRTLLEWNRKLISLRKTDPALKNTSKDGLFVYINNELSIILHRKSEDEQKHLLCFFNFSEYMINFHVPSYSSSWIKIIDSRDAEWKDEKKRDSEDVPSPDKLTTDKLTINPCSVVIYGNG